MYIPVYGLTKTLFQVHTYTNEYCPFFVTSLINELIDSRSVYCLQVCSKCHVIYISVLIDIPETIQLICQHI